MIFPRIDTSRFSRKELQRRNLRVQLSLAALRGMLDAIAWLDRIEPVYKTTDELIEHSEQIADRFIDAAGGFNPLGDSKP